MSLRGRLRRVDWVYVTYVVLAVLVLVALLVGAVLTWSLRQSVPMPVFTPVQLPTLPGGDS